MTVPVCRLLIPLVAAAVAICGRNADSRDGDRAQVSKTKEMTISTTPVQPSAEPCDLVMTRVFDARIAQVWKAWSDPDQVMRWWGPTGFTSPSCKMDFRAGGTTLVCMRAPQELGGQDMYSTWAYRVIEPMRRIEYIHNLADKDGRKVDPVTLGMPPDFPHDQLHTVTFKSLGADKTEMVVTEHGWKPGPMLEMSKLGLGQCLDKMGESLARP